MTIDELRDHLTRLINDYVTDPAATEHLLDLMSRADVPTKAILVGLTPFLSGVIKDIDAKTVGDIAFHFC